LPAQPTITESHELDQFEQEFLTPKEAFVFETLVDIDNNPNPWQTQTPRFRPRRQTQSSNRRYRTCRQTEHVFANCPDNRCNRCDNYGHISAHCSSHNTQITICKVCHLADHAYANCPENKCHRCNEYGHIGINCSLTPLKQANRNFQCRYSREEVESKRAIYYSSRRINHCCDCKTPQKPEDLCLLNDQLICKTCWTYFHQELDRTDPRSIEYFENGDSQGTLQQCKLCKEENIRSRMYKLDTMREDS
jgi:hypothetical protein